MKIGTRAGLLQPMSLEINSCTRGFAPLAAGYFLFVLIQLWRTCTAAARNVREQPVTEEASE